MDKAMLGQIGELAAARYLREKGYQILSANYRCRLGEIDIIAENARYICFVEVKTRSENNLYAPADAVDAAKRKRIVATAQLYLQRNPQEKQPRFDIIEVYLKNARVQRLRHIENAYDGAGK